MAQCPELRLERLVEVYEVTQWRDGCVYRTRKLPIGMVWVPCDQNPPHGTIWAVPPSNYDGQTIRRA